MLSRALFLDRDGTVIEDRGYLRDPESIVPLPGALNGLLRFADAGWKLIIVSNQSGVAREIVAPEEMNAVHNRFLDLLTAAGVPITESYLCPHGVDGGCKCRKPAIGSLKEAARAHGLNLRQSWMIGDRESDIRCGRSAGCRTIWLRNPRFEVDEALPTRIVDGWDELRPENLS